MTRPAASVVVTTFATPTPLLAISLATLLGQSLTDVEVVLVVDGELSESSAALVATIEADDERLVVVRPGRVGRARALNLGLAAANADLVGIQDADDASHPRRLEVQCAMFDRDPALAALGTGFRITSSLTDAADWAVTDEMVRSGPPRPVGRALLRSNPVVHSSLLARRSAVEAVGGYDEARAAQYDYDLLLRLSSAGETVATCDVPLVLHRRHAGQFFEGLDPVRRAWGSCRLQRAHIAALRPPARWGYDAIAFGRMGYQIARSVRWHHTSGRQKPAPIEA